MGQSNPAVAREEQERQRYEQKVKRSIRFHARHRRMHYCDGKARAR
jgi:hypothetical protein